MPHGPDTPPAHPAAPRTHTRFSRIASLGFALLAGCIAAVILLEAGIRAIGFVTVSRQARFNQAQTLTQGSYRILCVGDSMTENLYPHYLAQVLKEQGARYPCQVIDAGKGSTNSSYVARNIVDWIAHWKPHMVIVMTGNNDTGAPRPSILDHFRSLRLIRALDYIAHDVAGAGQFRAVNETTPLTAAVMDQASPAPNGAPHTQPDNNLALEYLYQIGDNKRCIAMAERMMRTDPGSTAIPAIMARALVRIADYERAERLLTEALDRHPGDLHILKALQETQVYTNSRRAMQTAAAYLKLDPANQTMQSQYHRLRSLIDQTQADLARGKRMLEKDPRDDSISLRMARQYITIGQHQEAVRLLMPLDAAGRGGGETPLLIAEANFFMGNRAAAIDYYRRAVKAAMLRKDQNLYIEICRLVNEKRLSGELAGAGPSASARDDDMIPVLPSSKGQGAFRYDLLWSSKNNRIECMQYDLLCALKTGQEGTARQIMSKLADHYTAGIARYSQPNLNLISTVCAANGVRLVVMQYPFRSIRSLRSVVTAPDVLFVENVDLFVADILSHRRVDTLFTDLCGRDYGHCTQWGNTLICRAIAAVIVPVINATAPDTATRGRS